MHQNDNTEINGDVLRTLREAMGLRQSELAQILGVGTNTVYRWEHNIYPGHLKMAWYALKGVLAERNTSAA